MTTADNGDPAITGLIELSLEVEDLELAATFYGDVLGLRVLTREQDRIWLAVGQGTRLGLWCPGVKEFGDQGGRHVHFAFSVASDRLPGLFDRLTAANVEIRGPVRHPGGDRSIYFRDPSGNVVEAWDALDRINDGESALGV